MLKTINHKKIRWRLKKTICYNNSNAELIGSTKNNGVYRMTDKKTFDMAEREKLIAELLALPKVEKQIRYTPVKLIESMAKEIRGMQEKGYTLQMILEILSSKNVIVGLSTLKKAIQESETKAKIRSPRKKKVEAIKDDESSLQIEQKKEDKEQQTKKHNVENKVELYTNSR